MLARVGRARSKMDEHSVGRPDGGTAPVFVDSSGGRRRTWRRLGWAMGAAGGGYALVVALSVIGGNSDAPWGVLIPGGDDKSGAARVVPEQDDDAQRQLPGASPSGTDEPSPGASAPAGASGADGARTPATSSKASPGTRATSGAGGTKAPADGGGSKGGASGTDGGTGGTGSTPADPPAEPAAGGGTGSTGGGGTPSDPTTEPGEPTPSESPSSQGGILDQVIDQLGGGGSAGTMAAGAE